MGVSFHNISFTLPDYLQASAVHHKAILFGLEEKTQLSKPMLFFLAIEDISALFTDKQ